MNIVTILVHFEGEGTPVTDAKGFIKSQAKGAILSVTSEGLSPEAQIESLPGDASFNTMVFAQDARFWEAGRVDFSGIDSHLIVETKHPGASVDLPEGAAAGSIAWTIIGGGGRFAGATGIVTGNFTARADGRFFDHHLYKVILPVGG
jgi:hypothetical protein